MVEAVVGCPIFAEAVGCVVVLKPKRLMISVGDVLGCFAVAILCICSTKSMSAV